MSKEVFLWFLFLYLCNHGLDKIIYAILLFMQYCHYLLLEEQTRSNMMAWWNKDKDIWIQVFGWYCQVPLFMSGYACAYAYLYIRVRTI